MKKLFLLLLAVLSVSLCVSAQTRTLRGTVVDATNDDPVIGASVQPAGSTEGVTTDIDGKFVLVCPASVKEITVSYVGMQTKTVAAEAGEMFIALDPSTEVLEQLVVTGYGTAKKIGSVVGSVAVVGEATFENVPTPTFVDALQGQVAGLNIYSNSGDPSSVNASIQIRGTNSLNASNTPLFILDGAPVSPSVFTTLNPQDIASITVLKDAASVAIYGSRAANGVIVITSKKGRFGEQAQLSIRASYGWSQMAGDNMDMMNADEYIKFSQMIGNKVPDEAYELVYKYGVDTNWLDEFFESAAPTYSLEAALQGGGEKASYYVSLGHLDQQGIIPKSGMRRTTLRATVDSKVNDWFRLGAQVNLGYTKNETNVYSDLIYNGGGVNLNNPIVMARMARPYDSARYWTRAADGSIQFGERADRLLYTALWRPDFSEQWRDSYTDRVTANVTLSETITPLAGLTIRAQQNVDAYEAQIHNRIYPHAASIETPFGSFPWGTAMDDGLTAGFNQKQTSRYYTFTYTNTAEYRHTFADIHDFTFLVGEESIITRSNGFGASTSGQYNDHFMLLSNGTEITMSDVVNSISDEVFNSYFFNLGYSYNDLYFIDANLRRDGSSKFAPGNRWSTFWSLGAMWNMKNEKFLQDVKWLDQARLRLSYGTTGNAGIGNYAYMGLVKPYTVTYNGKPGWGLSSVDNPKLQWETVKAWDLGLNFRVFNHLTADIDFYRKETCDMLVNVPVSYTTGWSSILHNIGNMTNTGVDIDLQADIIQTKDWYFGLRANFNYNANRITSLFDGMDQQAFPSSLLAYTVGHDASEFYMVKYAGVDPETGEPQWYDKDGNITKEYNVERDSQLLGKSCTAPITGGFGADVRWKGFALRADFAWAAKKYMVNNDRFFLESPSSDNAASYNQMTTMFNIWTHPGQITDIPKFGSTIQFDDHLLEDASFLRLKNLTLMYNCPKSFTDKLSLKGLNFHFTGRNLLTFTGFTGFDPEPGSNIVTFFYPNTRQYELGLEVTF